mgnify:CR=1 FL=1
MKKILLILPVLLISLCALAATDPQSEKQAEEFYREGKYNEAAEIYRKLRAGGNRLSYIIIWVIVIINWERIRRPY